MPFAQNAFSRDGAFIWGVNAITLKPISNATPSSADILKDKSAVLLNRFYRAGGINLPATPTECAITRNRDALFVVFRCQEDDMTFPAIHRSTNWYSMLNSPTEQDSQFPDKVDLFIQPDMGNRSYYQFAVTLDGLAFGCKRDDGPTETSEDSGASVRVKKVSAFEATLAHKTNEWIVLLRIPWKTLGGKPKSHFGLVPVRTRWRDGEVSSPVAFDFTERPPLDLFIETHLGDTASIQAAQTALCRLPSGVLRWQWPASLAYPDRKAVRQIWQMEQSLSEPTDTNNLARRLYLVQCWIDLLALEGFNFRAGIGSIADKGMQPFVVRREVNDALRRKDMPHACRWLDGFLHKLDKTSSDWFADGSPADILTTEWIPISRLDGLEAKTNALLLLGSAGKHQVELHLSLPATGGVRIYGQDEGCFKPSSLLPLHVVQSTNSCSIEAADGKIIIHRAPFTISLCDADGNTVTRIGPNGIAFRFNRGGKVIAVDFSHDLEANEVICGFGEKYDRFNENGNVLTLWGMDDWFGNTVGLMNQSYKPIPILQSSKGYMIFDNSTYRLRADIGKTHPNQYRLTQQGPIFDYYFWFGPPERGIQSYTALTGKPILPPKWAFEPWIGRTGRAWEKPLHDPVAEEESVVKRFQKLDIPHSAIYAEGPSADSPVLNQFMAAHGIKVLSWFYPVIPRSRQAQLMPEIEPGALPFLHAESDDLPWLLVDFSNPNALELCQCWWAHRLKIGVAGSMVDFGDRVPEDAEFYNGGRGDRMHNFYSYDYDRTINQVFREQRGNNFILFARAAAPGTQKWAAQFAGDHPANFAGLQAVLTGALNLCACGFSTWGSDLGGFLGWPEPAVYMRWTQFACFSPLMRAHGRTPREPWNYGEPAVANYKYYAWVRENLLDYIYNAAFAAHQTGIPLMRSMAVAFPADPALATVRDEYMFGDSLLVAPVVTENSARAIHLPSGEWTSLWDGKTVSGPADFKANVPLDKISVYLTQGAVVPVQLNPALTFGASMTQGRVNALIVTPPKREADLLLLNHEGQSAGLILRPKADGFALMLTNFPETDYLLLYGAAVTAVKVDGAVLPNLPGTESASQPAGWQADPGARRFVVHLPRSRDRQREVEVELQATNRNE